jgi:hypothetical protein
VTRRLLLPLLLVALLVAGCGPPSAKIYSETKSRACLRAKRIRTTPPPASDFVATTALAGSFRAKLKDNFVTVSFGDTLDHADNIDQAYRSFRAHNVGIDDVLRTQGNAVMLWHAHPSDVDLALVQGCLTT